MKILYIGETATHEQYLKGNVPSHWFYGAVEMEKDGHEVIWAQERPEMMNDMKLLKAARPDCIFIPNLNLHNHLLLLFLSSVGLVRQPIFAYLHHEPRLKKGIKARLYKQLLGGVRHLFFLSEQTMKQITDSGMVSAERCSVPGWGPDMDFYDAVDKSDGDWFISTGKENRDFATLIEAFRATGALLHIITAKEHNKTSYESLADKCRDIPNIKVSICDNSSVNYPSMVGQMASAKALVCPLLPDKLNYCVGLSTIADAEGLRKPLIITKNPYHDVRPTQDGFLAVSTIEDWISAIYSLQNSCPDRKTSDFSMSRAYARMKPIMKL